MATIRHRKSRKHILAAAGLAGALFSTAVVHYAMAGGGTAGESQTATASPKLKNGGFEEPANFTGHISSDNVPGWNSLGTDKIMEFWSDGFDGGDQGKQVPAHKGKQFLELNSTGAHAIYQDVATTPGETMVWRLAHRGRDGADTAQLALGPSLRDLLPQSPLNGPFKGSADLTDGTDKWGEWYGIYVVPAGQTTTSLAIAPTAVASGKPTAGNFLDSVSFEQAPHITGSTSGADHIQRGSTFTVTTAVLHQGGDRLDKAVYRVALPAGTSVDPASVRVNNQAVGDKAEAANGTLRVRLGDGASGTQGGATAPGAEHTVSYQLKVDAQAPKDSAFTVQPSLDYDWVPGISRTTELGSVRVPLASADLKVTGAFADDHAVAGAPVRFTVAVENTKGPHAAAGNQLRIHLPAGLSGVAVTGDGAQCPASASGTLVDCAIPSLSKGSRASVTVTGSAPADLTDKDTLTATAVVTSATDDPDASDNSAAFTAGVKQEADLALTHDVAPSGRLEPGDDITYTVSLKNNGPSRARDVKVSGYLPEGMSATNTIASTGTYDSATGVWTAGDVPSGATATLRLTATVPADRDDIVYASEITHFAVPDPVLTNNRAESKSDITQKARLGVGIAADKKETKPGGEVSYTISVNNEGPSRATGVEVTDQLPEGMPLKSATPSSGTFDAPTGIWNVGEIASGGTAKLTLIGIVPADRDKLDHLATLTRSATPDPGGDPGSAPAHRATASITVTQQADLEAVLTAAHESVKPNQETSVVVKVTNMGPSTAPNTRVQLSLPGNAENLTDNAAGAFDVTTGVWQPGDMASGEAKEFTLSFAAKDEKDLTLAVTGLSSGVEDPRPCNDVCATTTISVGTAGGDPSPEPTPSPTPPPTPDPTPDPTSEPSSPTTPTTEPSDSTEPTPTPTPETDESRPADGAPNEEPVNEGALATTGSQVLVVSIVALVVLAGGVAMALASWRRK